MAQTSEFGTTAQVWLPISVAEKLKQQATLNGHSLSGEIRDAVLERLHAADEDHGPRDREVAE